MASWAGRRVLRAPRFLRSCGGARCYQTLAGALAAADPARPALIAPLQNVHLSYKDLSTRVQSVATVLAKQNGYGPASAPIATDLPSCVENLVLQLAASHIGASVLTLKNLEKVPLTPRGAVMTGPDSFLKEYSASMEDGLRCAVDKTNDVVEFSTLCAEPSPQVELLHDGDAPLGYYASAKPITNAAALQAGKESAEKLAMTPDDVVLVSITLNHIFGIGSAVSAALRSGACIVLPDASGLLGCGNPKQRADATLKYLESEKCTLMYADTHTLKALPEVEAGSLPSLRGGIVKVGSGTTFLEQSVTYAGVEMFTMGKA